MSLSGFGIKFILVKVDDIIMYFRIGCFDMLYDSDSISTAENTCLRQNKQALRRLHASN